MEIFPIVSLHSKFDMALVRTTKIYALSFIQIIPPSFSKLSKSPHLCAIFVSLGKYLCNLSDCCCCNRISKIISLASSLINFWWSIIFSFLKPSTINFLLIVLLVALDFNWIVNSIDVSLCFLILNIDVSYLFLSILLILIKLLKFESFIASLNVWLFFYSF